MACGKFQAKVRQNGYRRGGKLSKMCIHVFGKFTRFGYIRNPWECWQFMLHAVTRGSACTGGNFLHLILQSTYSFLRQKATVTTVYPVRSQPIETHGNVSLPLNKFKPDCCLIFEVPGAVLRVLRVRRWSCCMSEACQQASFHQLSGSTLPPW